MFRRRPLGFVSSTRILWSMIVVAAATLAVASPDSFLRAADGTVTGVVFNDFDVNGSRRTTADAVNNLRAEPGVSGVTVRAFDAIGATVGTATTDSNGAYTLAVTGASTSNVRVEFTVPSGYQPSFAPSGGSSIQFVSLGATNVNLGVQIPGDYCQANPLVTCTLVDETVGTFGSIRGFNWNNSGSDVPIATNTETGAIWGLAWHPQSRKLFSAPTVRRLTKVYESPAGTPRLGQLFISGTSSATTQPYVDVASLGVDVGTIPNWATRTTSVGGVTDGFSPNGTWDLTGKVGIGDIDVSPDGSTLWFVNLHDRKLYGLDIGGGRITPGADLTSADVRGYALPDPSCTGGVFRPWAIGVHDDASVFVGGVCTAESGGTRANLEAVVYRFTPSTGTFGASPVLRFRLDYTKGNAHVGSGTISSFGNLNNRWYTWWETPSSSSLWWSDRGAMPILSDIEIASDGSMSLGFADRMAQRAQSTNAKTSGLPGKSSVTNWFWSAGGDILRACTADEQTWQIEPLKPTITSRACVIGGTTYFTGISHTGQQSGEQEFYNDTAVDYSYADYGGGFVFEGGHLESALGGLATYPGATHVVGTFYDTNSNYYTGGARWFSQSNGARRLLPTSTTGDRQLADESGAGQSFGKAGGLGDIEILCDAAPLQIGDRLWIDADNDGIQDPGELPLAGVTVRLYDSTNTLVSTAVTDLNGQYRFSSTVTEAANGGGTPDAEGGNLQPYTAYTVRLDNPDDYAAGGPLEDWGLAKANQLTSNSNDQDDAIDSDATFGTGTSYGIDKFPQISVPELEPGHVNHTFDFGFADQAVSVGDRVFFDVDGDGVHDAGEPGVAGVTLTLTNADGTPVTNLDGQPVTTTTTNANGYYSFDNLPAGQYKVVMTTPSGFTPTTPLSDTSSTLILGEEDLTLDFGVTKPSVSVGNLVWSDSDRDGIQDAGEPGISGVTLTITKADGAPAIDIFGNTVTTTTTDANGAYLFPNLSTGQYTVTVTAPAGLAPTVAGTGTSSTDSSTGSATSAVLSSNGASDLTLDFGFVTPSVSVGNLVWFDANNDGVQDPGEPGMAGVMLTLTKSDGTAVTDIFGNPVTTTTTDASGNYLFDNLPVGRYKVSVSSPVGFQPAQSGQGVSANDSSTGSEVSAQLTINGTSDQTLDFGFFAPSVSVGDLVWFDTNRDGIQDMGERGISGVTLTLTKSDGTAVTDIFGIPVTTTVTDANGNYSFENLPFGQYAVTIAAPSGLIATVDGAGTASTDSSSGSETSVQLTVNGSSDTTLDFGFYAPVVSVGNFVWFDTDRDGVHDADEQGISGVTVTLTKADGTPVTDIFGNPVATTTTDANGNYSFDNLPVGTYKVTVTTPSELVATTDTERSSISLSVDGASDLTLDFGFARVQIPVSNSSASPTAPVPAVTPAASPLPAPTTKSGAPKASPRTAVTSPGTSVSFCPGCASTPSKGARFVPSKTALSGMDSGTWSRRLRTSQGIWSIENDKVIFTPAPGFSGTTTVRYRLTDSNGKSVVSTFTASVKTTVAALPVTGPKSVRSLIEFAVYVAFAGFVMTAVSRRRRTTR